MVKWQLIYILMAFILILSNIGLSCKPLYEPNEEVIIYDNIISLASGSDCNITIFKNETNVTSG